MRLSVLAAATATFAAAIVTPALAHEKDLRTRTDGTGETEISFCSRPSPNSFGFPGHAFVVFSEKNVGEPRNFRAIGHTVATGTGGPSTIFTYFGGAAVSGKQAEERFTHLKQECLTLKVDREIYQKALTAARPTLTALGFPDEVAASVESYALNANDCIDFAIRVAQPIKTVGFTIPARAQTHLPTGYIQKMIKANP